MSEVTAIRNLIVLQGIMLICGCIAVYWLVGIYGKLEEIRDELKRQGKEPK